MQPPDCQNGGVRAIDDIVERKVREARDAGYFDDLPGAGKPIPDLDDRREPGWWGERFVRRERHQLLREELVSSVRRALPALQRSAAADRADGVDRLNERIAGYNRVTTVAPLPLVDRATAAWSPE